MPINENPHLNERILTGSESTAKFSPQQLEKLNRVFRDLRSEYEPSTSTRSWCRSICPFWEFNEITSDDGQYSYHCIVDNVSLYLGKGRLVTQIPSVSRKAAAEIGAANPSKITPDHKRGEIGSTHLRRFIWVTIGIRRIECLSTSRASHTLKTRHVTWQTILACLWLQCDVCWNLWSQMRRRQ